MLSDRIISLRKSAGMTQEALADRLGVSRQTLSKWQTGESSPDIEKAGQLALIFDVTLDSLVNEATETDPLHGLAPRGKYAYGMVRIGDKGQIVIPARARRQFGLMPGDNLIVLGDEKTGLALIPESFFTQMMAAMRSGQEE